MSCFYLQPLLPRGVKMQTLLNIKYLNVHKRVIRAYYPITKFENDRNVD